MEYKNIRPMDLKKAQTEAKRLANLTGVNHVVVNIDKIYNIYTEKEYPIGYLELISPEKKPEIKIESIIEETKPIKKKVNVSKEA